ncbi:hypothetical protein ECC02_006740 [Trypanosoma cruzi]|uniref:Uncharacterized protein n=1 Tax=Trypanosoma cruzi TaxID=5693 RepID=A0A7J6Y0L5_TRYCR|nr:hypothetical protein ECC02_006740 [Trypanosoma cruzi]
MRAPLPRVGGWESSLRVRCVLAAGLWLYPVGRGTELEAVELCLFSFLSIGVWLLAVCAFFVWRAESSHPRTDGTAMVRVCVRAGVELPARARVLAVLFPPVVFFFCVLQLLTVFPVIISSFVPAWSGRMLTGHVDCECLLTASIHFSLPAFTCWVRFLREGRCSPRTSCVCVLLPFSVGDGPPCCPFRIVLCPALCVGALLCSPLACLMYCCCCSSPPHAHGHARKESKQALLATVNFEGSERTNNSTHTHRPHTHICMLTRVAAVKAPRTHNRRRVTGSSGRRREGRESEPQRPNMSRRVFYSAVLLLLLLVMWMCCGPCEAAAASTGENSVNARLPRRFDLFVPQTTVLLPRGGVNSEKKWNSFASPSLVSAGGVIAAFAEGHPSSKESNNASSEPSSDAVAWYIDSAWDWSTLVAEVKKSTWQAHTVLGKADGTERFDVVLRPTTTTKDNKVFLLAGSSDASNVNESWSHGGLKLKLVVGDVRKPTDSEQSGWINWGEVQSPLNETTGAVQGRKLTGFVASGGAGVLMEDGTLVFSLMAKSEEEDVYSMIIYSKDNGSTWALSNSVSSAKCVNPRITEWEGKLLMIVDCESGQRVYESRDMGRSWTEAIGGLLGIWVKSQSGASQDLSLHVEALITATIEGRKVMLYTQRGYVSGENKATALYVWVTDNNRSFHVGPVGMDNAEKEELASSLLYSGGNLHLLQQRDNDEGSVMSLSRLTEELSTIKSVLSTWSQKDIFFSSFSIPTAGLVAVLSGAASDGRWNDEYLCLNATVRNAVKVKEGMQLTESNSRVLWPVNTRGDNLRHVFLSHDFTVVATVSIENVPSGKTPLLTATLANTESNHTMGILYTADKKMETVFKDKTTRSSTWEPKKEYQVALMLQGKKASVHIDGRSLGEGEVLLTDEKSLELVHFCFGACVQESSPTAAGQHSPVTVKNVFLYNRPLNSTEMRAIKDKAHTFEWPRGIHWRGGQLWRELPPEIMRLW